MKIQIDTIDSIKMYESDRPKFKGMLHAIAFYIYMIGLPLLVESIPKDLTLPIGFYLFGVIGHFAASTILHIYRWYPSEELILRRLDHSMIFINIAGSYAAALSTVLTDCDPIVPAFLYTGTVLGIGLRLLFTDIHPVLISIPYLMTGWAIVLDPKSILLGFHRLPDAASLFLLVGILYSIGAMIYAFKWPNPWPKHIEFHEVFHMFTTVATILLTWIIYMHCIPYAVEL